MDIDGLFKIKPYELKVSEKLDFLIKRLNALIEHHKNRCFEYKKLLKAHGVDNKSFTTLYDMPYLSVRLFKDFNLSSTPQDKVIKTLVSSGTTSTGLSKITLDKTTAMYQTRALVNILQDFLGRKRLPMLIIDNISSVKGQTSHTARGAGILGLSNFGKDHTYILDENMELDVKLLEDFLIKHKDQNILIFGFTFMVWKYFYKKLLTLNKNYDLGKAFLIHSGGWKKLIDMAVDNSTFKSSLKDLCNITNIHNFYGMVEQVGSIFMECSHGMLHAPNFSDIVIRDPLDWKEMPFNNTGVVEVFSVLPESYPGHILLTEDTGIVHGNDDCKCGRYGKYFTIKGRVPKAELRGCSDTHAFNT